MYSKVPVVWDIFCKEAGVTHQKALERYQERKQLWDQAMKDWRKNKKKDDDPPEEPQPPTLRMQAGEELNFLRFATALKIMVGSSIRTEKVARAAELLEEYLLGFSDVFSAHILSARCKLTVTL